MIRKFLLLAVALLLGRSAAVEAKTNYVPLYISEIIDTQSDVKSPKKTPAAPLFITQVGYKLILPKVDEEVHTFMVLKDSVCVYTEPYQYPDVALSLPMDFDGDYEVRISADTYYYYGYITLEREGENGVPGETDAWENITVIGSNSSQEAMLESLMKLHVVEYDLKEQDHSNDYEFANEESKEAYLQRMAEYYAGIRTKGRIGLLKDEVREMFPQIVDVGGGFQADGVNIYCFIAVLVSCVQELKTQLDNRTEAMIDILMARGSSSSDINAVRAAVGNTILSAAPSPVGESATVRYLIGSDAANAFVAVTDMGGRVVTRVPVSPSETSVSIDSDALNEGIYLCTLYVNGENIGTKRLVKTR